MHHTRNLRFVFGFYRDTVTVASLGDHGILQIGAAGTVYHGKKLAVDLISGGCFFPTDFF